MLEAPPRNDNPSDEPELLRLLRIVGEASERGDLREALRHADRALRLVPESLELALIYARLLLKNRDAGLALAILERAAGRHSDPEIEASAITALTALDEIESACSRLEAALGRYALVASLAVAARRVARLMPAPAGWIGITPLMELRGEIIGAAAGIARLELGDAAGEWSRDHRIDCEENEQHVAAFCLAPLERRPSFALTARVAGAPLLGSGLEYPPDFRLDARTSFADGVVRGWVTLGWSPTQALELTVKRRGQSSLRLATSADPLNTRRQLFSFDPGRRGRDGDGIDIAATLPDGRKQSLPDAPFLCDLEMAELPVGRSPARPRAGRPTRQIDVIVPVYDGFAETLACLHSAMSTVGAGHGIVVIDDASPDPELALALDRMSAEGSVTLLRNPRNLGFTATVNRGLNLHPDRDAVILNADAEVFEGWLERLQHTAYSEPKIGTVTPLTNSGTIASYPSDESATPTAEDAAALDRLAAQVNRRRALEIPTGVGFCMYIRRDCLEEIGGLDARVFSQGYGEENDFCLRAEAAGWRHLLAGDVFVRHRGGRSFGSRRDALMARGMRLLNLRYPGYSARIGEFLAADPAGELRRRLDEERLAARAGRCVAFVTLAYPGGIERHLRDRTDELREQGFFVLCLRPDTTGNDFCKLTVDDGELRDLRYALPQDLAALRALLARLRLDHVELHHFLGHHPQTIETMTSLGCPYDVIIHDYALVCPRIMFAGENQFYCGEPDLAACETCIETRGSMLEEDITVAGLRRRSAAWMHGARAVIVPCEDAASRVRHYFPGIEPRIKPWETIAAADRSRVREPGAALRVLVIGALAWRKGYQLLVDCARDASERNLALEFIVIGYTEDDEALQRTGKVFVTGKYEESEIDGLIAREDPDLAFFPHVTPETWSYTLTHALKAGLPVVAFDLGAIAERLRDFDGSFLLLPLGIDARTVNDRLLRAAEREVDRRNEATPHELLSFTPHDILRNMLERANGARYPMPNAPIKLTSSVETLSLARGMYFFFVRSAGPTRLGDDQELILPALHVGPAPGANTDDLTIMSGPRTKGSWLCETTDMLVVKVSSGPATVVLTSLRTEGMAPLAIEVQRLDARNPVGALGQPEPASAQLAPVVQAVMPAPSPVARVAARVPQRAEVGGRRMARLQITAHIQNKGDMQFVGPAWAGCIGQHLAIESFSILPLDEIAPDQIEYKALTATGIETPWVGGGAACGTRGFAVALVGFAVRIKSRPGGTIYDCEYRGSFVSGKTSGPFMNGAPCRAAAPNDALEGIQLSVFERPRAQQRETVAAPGPATRDAPDKSQKRKAPPRPRFSVFREPIEK